MKRLKKLPNGRLKIRLAGRHRYQLQRAARTHEKPQIRERAAAILKVADGQSIASVAATGLLVVRHRSTVYDWVHHYFTHGLHLWNHKRRRRAKLTDDQQQKLMSIVIDGSPSDFGSDQSRWTLALLSAKVGFLSVYKSLSGIFYLLRALYLSWIRCRDVVYSPDPTRHYKIRRNRRILGYVRKHPQKAVMLFLDEFSVYRQPLRGKAWARKGSQPKSVHSCTVNTRHRIVGAINAVNGQLHFAHAAKITVTVLLKFLQTLREAYPEKRIYLVLDNWHNVHRNHRTYAKLEQLNIIALWQPLYMPQSNPIERLWGHLSDKILRIHRLSDRWSELKERVIEWLNQFCQPSQQVLQMTGLLSTPAIRTVP